MNATCLLAGFAVVYANYCERNIALDRGLYNSHFCSTIHNYIHCVLCRCSSFNMKAAPTSGAHSERP